MPILTLGIVQLTTFTEIKEEARLLSGNKLCAKIEWLWNVGNEREKLCSIFDEFSHRNWSNVHWNLLKLKNNCKFDSAIFFTWF